MRKEWESKGRKASRGGEVGLALALKALLILLLALILGAGSTGEGQGQVEPKLSGALQRLLELRAAGFGAAQSYAQIQGVEIKGPDERLEVVIEGVGDLSSQIRAQGGIPQAKYKGLWQVELPLASVQPLSQAAAVRYIRLPQVALAPSFIFGLQSGSLVTTTTADAAQAQGTVVSEGVALIGADQLHSQGITGRGVKLGIIDMGFAGLDRLIERGELPPDLIAWNCRAGPCRKVTPLELSQASGGEVHGAGVAEIAHDVAPDAQLHLFLIKTEVELGQAVTQATDEGLQVINHSVGWFNDGSFYDGRGVIGDIVRTARRNGIFWVNAAGNFAQAHYEAVFQDRNGDRYHDEDIQLDLEAGYSLKAFFTWDAWPRTNEDFDLFLERGPRQETASINRQNGTEPDEHLSFPVSEGGTYRLRIKWVGEGSPPQNRRMELFFSSLPPGVRPIPVVPESSLPSPANATEGFAVGAVGVGGWEVGELQPFSSWGPTNDGREKPDLVGPDCVRTVSYELAQTAAICGADGRFPGTSAAAPHVAGAAALLLSEEPGRKPSDLERLLKEGARAVPGRTANQVGAGRVSLLPPETLPDLVISSVQAEPKEAEPGATVLIRARVKNSGSAAAGPFWVAIWSAEEEGKTGRELDSQRVGGLEAGEEHEVTLRWTVPKGKATGEQRLVVVADPFGDVREKDETNNREELIVSIKPPIRPAFFAVGPISVSPGTTFTEGTTATFEAKITNQGDEAGTKPIEFSVDGEKKESKSLTLHPGKSEAVRFSYKFDKAGRYTVRISSPDDSKEVTVEVKPLPPAVLEVSPTKLEFQAKEGGSNPSAKPLTIRNTGGQSLNWKATTDPEAKWLKLDRASGSVAAGQDMKVQVSVDISGLSAGTHRAAIIITAPGAQNSPAKVEVTLEIAPSLPVLKVSPTSLSFSAKAGGSNPNPKELTITNAGGGLLEWQVTTNVNWIKPGMSGSSLEAGQSSKLWVFVNIQGLSAGTHKGTVTISAPGAEGSPVRVEVTLTLS